MDNPVRRFVKTGRVVHPTFYPFSRLSWQTALRSNGASYCETPTRGVTMLSSPFHGEMGTADGTPFLSIGVSFGRKTNWSGSAEAGTQEASHARENPPPEEVILSRPLLLWPGMPRGCCHGSTNALGAARVAPILVADPRFTVGGTNRVRRRAIGSRLLPRGYPCVS
jgi:hypothetical protein